MSHGMMRVLDRRMGDKKVTWDRNDPDDIENALAQFDYWTKEKGMKAYRVDKKGKKTGEEITKFDVEAEEILFVPAMALAGG